MKKEFVTYEIASKLKELMFDEKCLCTYAIKEKTFHRNPSNDMIGEEIEEPYTWQNSKIHESVITAPLWQQAIDFLRTFNIEIIIQNRVFDINNKNRKKLFDVQVEYLNENNKTSTCYVRCNNDDGVFTSYYDAREAGILKAIEILLKIGIKNERQ